MLTRDEYLAWWATPDQDIAPIPQDVAITLMHHVTALTARIDELAHPDTHDLAHGRGCPCYAQQCCCAYDYPTDICYVHKGTSDASRT